MKTIRGTITLALLTLALSGTWSLAADPAPNSAAAKAAPGATAAGDALRAVRLHWLILSPIPVVTPGTADRPDDAAQQKAFTTDLLASQGGEAGVRPAPGDKYSVNGVERQWRAVDTVGEEVSLNSVERKDDFEIAYASADFDSPSGAPAWLGIGSDDGIRVWLNGVLVHEKWIGRGVQVDQDVILVHPAKGRNHLVLKVQNMTGNWGFACRFMDAGLRAERMVAAATAGDQASLTDLASRGFDLNARTPDGLTPYLAALLWGQKNTAEFLAQKGADAKAVPPPLGTLADRIFKEWNSPGRPGISVAVIEKGRVVFEKGYGTANLEYGVPIRPDTVFHVASVSKQFTAMAVVLLERDGKLSLDDDVHKVLTELPDYGAKITIRNLLQHTSGVRDQWQTLALAGWNLQDVITQDQILRMLFRQKELNFAPGTNHLYSNAGFTLLAEIVTRVAGKPFPEFCAERIFAPLGMTHTHFHQRLEQLVPGRAYSYEKSAAGYDAAPLNYANAGATSLFTTAEDLVKWLDNFRTAQVGGAAGVARMQEDGVLADGTKIGYGMGVALGDFRGLKTISHGGADAGYRSQVLWFPEQQWGVAVLSNAGGCNPYELAQEMAAVCLHDRLAPADAKPAPVERKFVTVDPRELEKYAGTYPLPKINQTFVAVVENGKLWAAGPVRPPIELRPTGPAHFFLEAFQADIEFAPNASGQMVIKIIQPGAVNEGVRGATVGPVETDLRPYAGVYWSEELETQYTFFVRDGKLFGRHAHHGEFALQPTARDQFSTELWFASQVEFLRDSAGKIVGLTLGGDRVKGIRFTRRSDTPAN